MLFLMCPPWNDEMDICLFTLHSETQQLVSPPSPSHRQAGATVVHMQVAGRWKSSQMSAHYAKAELVERGAIARFKDGKSR